MAIINCRHYLGYKPCGKSAECNEDCPAKDVVVSRLLVVHLEALGAVLRATAILPAIKRKYPRSHITWITQSPAHKLLVNNPFIDRLLTTERDDLLALEAIEFDVAFSVDKSLKAVGVLRRTSYDQLFGFDVDPRSGGIIPANPEAKELWEIGLSDERKFFENKKTEIQLITESLALDNKRDEYQCFLTEDEEKERARRCNEWRGDASLLIGINTGCSTTIPYKKLSVEGHRRLIKLIQREIPGSKVVILGGPEDRQRNMAIADGLDLISSDTDRGLRDGLISVGACDLVFTGDSLGMHMAIAMKRWVVAWFGPTCAHEIELYGRGFHILSKAPCAPCWKRACQMEPMCYDQVDFSEVLEKLKAGILWRIETSSFKRPSSEMRFSLSPS
jgi:heptosyltransferase-2